MKLKDYMDRLLVTQDSVDYLGGLDELMLSDYYKTDGTEKEKINEGIKDSGFLGDMFYDLWEEELKVKILYIMNGKKLLVMFLWNIPPLEMLIF